MSTTNDPHSASPPPAPDPASEELVAYLDGELAPDDCRQVEERLAADPDYRRQLNELDQAWEALDSLPSSAPGDDFARTTIEMVTLAARADQEQRSAVATAADRRRRRGWFFAAAVAVLIGFLAARWFLPDANARLLADLPAITQMDLLDQIHSVEFLKQLSKGVPFDQLAADEAAVEREQARLKSAGDPSFEVRRQWIETLLPDQKANLAAQAKQFDEMRPEERRRLQDLQQQIATAPDSDELLKTLSAYGQWLTRRTSSEQSELRRMSTDERIHRIHELLARDSRLAARRLPESDVKPLRDAIFQVYNEYKDSEDFKKAIRRRDRDDRPRRPLRSEDMPLLVASWALLWQEHIDDRTYERIKKDLSPQTQGYLDQLARREGERGAKGRLLQWMREVMIPRREVGEIERFFAEDLAPDQREYLLSLPRDQMEAQLERFYIGDRVGLRGQEWPGNPNERGPRPGPPDWPPNGPPRGGPDMNRGPGPNRGPEGYRGPDDRRGPRPDRPPFPPPDGPRPNGPPPEPRGNDPI